MKFMCHLAHAMGLQQKSWFDAVNQFDVFCALYAPGLVVNDISGLCTAIVTLLQKQDGPHYHACERPSLICIVNQLVEWLRQQGVPVAEVTEDCVDLWEGRILEVLEWNCIMPSVEMWSSASYARLNALSRSVYSNHLGIAWKQSVHNLKRLLLLFACSNDLQPRNLAGGMMCLMLVNVRLLPLDAFRPACLSAEAWASLYQQSQNQSEQEPCAVPPAEAERLLKLLAISTGRSVAGLQEDCRAAAELCKEANQAAQVHEATV